jgi:putative transposase
MNNNIPILTDNKTFEEVISCLEENISLETQGECDQRTVFEILIRAASANDSVENTCNMLKNVPCGNDIRYHLDKYDDMENLETQLNDAIQSRLPPRIKNGKQRLAIDFNL